MLMQSVPRTNTCIKCVAFKSYYEPFVTTDKETWQFSECSLSQKQFYASSAKLATYKGGICATIAANKSLDL